jgi:DNA-directed RNA polymerase subunit RPC12/RpoP
MNPNNKFSRWLRRFMEGRCGNDRLNMAILTTGLVLCLLHLFIPNVAVKMVTWLLSYVLMFLAIARCLSRNTYRRYQENRKFLQLVHRFTDRQHRYYDCPKCRQTVRVPRGKGKIAISCPKCGEKFIRKT